MTVFFCGDKHFLTWVKESWEMWVFPKVKRSYSVFRNLFIPRRRPVSHRWMFCSGSRWGEVPGACLPARPGIVLVRHSGEVKRQKEFTEGRPPWPYQENGTCTPSCWLNKSYLHIQDQTKHGGREEPWRKTEDLDLDLIVRIIGGFTAKWRRLCLEFWAFSSCFFRWVSRRIALIHEFINKDIKKQKVVYIYIYE